jgi:hypothetical protein
MQKLTFARASLVILLETHFSTTLAALPILDGCNQPQRIEYSFIVKSP